MKTVLVIEDSVDIRENIVELLALTGYRTLEAGNGREGVKLALKHLPDLIVCDIMMPELDGYGVLHILGKHKETLNIPLIFLTAKAEKADIRKGLVLGATDYITKPFEESDLLSQVEMILNREHKPTAHEPAEQLSFDDLFAHKIDRSFTAGDFIFREGDTPTHVYYINSGKVKLIKMNNDGKEAVVELCKEGDFLGYWSALEERNQSETAEIIDDSSISLIPIEDFNQVLKSNADVSQVFLKMLSKNLLIKQSKILELAYESVRKRTANALISMCDIYGEGQTLKMKIPRELIASMAGTSVETAIRMMSEFKKDRLIAVDGSEIKILEYQKLKNAPY